MYISISKCERKAHFLLSSNLIFALDYKNYCLHRVHFARINQRPSYSVRTPISIILGTMAARNKGAELITEIGHDKAKKLISSAVYYMSLSLKCVRTYVARRPLFTNICQGTGTRRRLYSFHFRSIDLYFHFLDVYLLQWWAVVSMDTR